MTVFGSYEYLVYYHLNKHESSSGDTVPLSFSSAREQSTSTILLAHFGAGAVAGIMQSSVLTTWELVSKVSSHNFNIPHNLRTQFLMRRAVHHSIGYACLFGTYEATRRLFWHATYPFLEQHDATLLDETNVNHTRDIVVSLATAFFAGGFAGQVHQFVSYITSHWKLSLLMAQPTTSSTSNDFSIKHHARQYTRQIPSFRSNLSAFVPTALCFVAFQYGEQVTSRLASEHFEQQQNNDS